ncbi:MAG: DHH family phosphoesterase [Sulfolobales archaeon]|nr:DHH family phosphoesterase [Sulfolobales archaeon]
MVIVTHRNADVDSVAAAVTLSYALKLYSGTNFDVCVPEGADAVSRRVLSGLGFNIPESEKCSSRRVVFIDVSSPTQVEGVEFEECSLVDHHSVNTLVERCSPRIYDPSSKATSAILAEVLMLSRYAIPRNYATLLLAGILFDTRFLRIADSRLLRVTARLLDIGADLEEATHLLVQQEVPYAERVARLKSLSRMGIYVIGDRYIVTVTCVGAYESSSLKYSVEAGSDVAIAIASRDSVARITIRASGRFVKDVGTPVAAELAKYLGERLGGSGGGHEAAAGAAISRNYIRGLEKAIADFFELRGFKMRVLDRGRWMEECA